MAFVPEGQVDSSHARSAWLSPFGFGAALWRQEPTQFQYSESPWGAYEQFRNTLLRGINPARRMEANS
jgi:hypothetical protein